MVISNCLNDRREDPVENTRRFTLSPPKGSAMNRTTRYRKRDESRKYVHDPLTSITKQSAAHPSVSTSSSSKAPYRSALPSKVNHDKPPEVQARLSRESTERERALELIRRKQREMQGNATPSVSNDSGYGDVYNKREVEEAHRFRDRRWDSGHRHWNDDDRHKSRPSKL